MNFLQGHLLVAASSLRDPNFSRSVVLLVRHNEEGAFGLMLNRSTNTRVVDVWKQISSEPCASEQAIRVGGPIQGPLMSLHANSAAAELEVLPGVYFAAGREQLEMLVAAPDPSARFFVGYSGWGPGQLESELAEGAWGTVEAGSESVFRDLDQFWEAMQRQVGGSRLMAALGIKHVPTDPRLN